jgi:hypothetical protein
MAPGNPFQGHPGAVRGSMLANRVYRVDRTGGVESTCARRKNGGYQHLIAPDERHEEGLNHDAPLQFFPQLPAYAGNIRMNHREFQPSNIHPRPPFEGKDQ